MMSILKSLLGVVALGLVVIGGFVGIGYLLNLIHLLVPLMFLVLGVLSLILITALGIISAALILNLRGYTLSDIRKLGESK